MSEAPILLLERTAEDFHDISLADPLRANAVRIVVTKYGRPAFYCIGPTDYNRLVRTDADAGCVVTPADLPGKVVVTSIPARQTATKPARQRIS